MKGQNKTKIKFSKLRQQIDFSKTSTRTLIFSNLLVLFFAVVDNLSTQDFLWIYWLQSVIIGIFTFIRIKTLKNFSTDGFKINRKEVLNTKSTAVFTSYFFLFHYGFFHLTYGAFLFVSSFTNKSGSNRTDPMFIFLSAVMFFINYLIEYNNNKKEESEKLQNIGKMMFAPYIRIVPMHLTVIFGGPFILAEEGLSVSSNLAVITLFIVIKTTVDLITHSIDFSTSKKQAEVSVD